MYITDLKAISPQLTYNNELLTGEKVDHEAKVYNVIEPDYLEIIPKGLLRRMGRAIRMGIGAGLPLVKTHEDLDAVIIGTANGGLEDCIKFLNQIVEYDEGILTPTNFVQSTPNAVAGLLALMGKNRGYNITYTNGGLAFEDAVLDAWLLFHENAVNKVLIGGIEEISDYNYNIDSLAGKYKDEIVKDTELIQSTTKGTVCGEGSSLFVLEKSPADYYAKIDDVAQITYPTEMELDKCVNDLLERNNLTTEDIDSIMLGYNGDVEPSKWYGHVENHLLPSTNSYSFKNLSGDYRASSAFALWLSAHMMNGEKAFLPHIELRKKHEKEISRILIYNHFDGVRHGFILLSK
ncbi:MAG: beta-ketoacyl synthase chain length factor [Crocinitomicaceae bacterium]|nr:beta-ketoacyl synthase chain length factor [Crocinitomicaceae bacterium]